MEIDDQSKIAILMQEEKIAAQQQLEIKRDEMSWLKVYLIFYGAIITWMSSRWSIPSPTANIDDEKNLIYITLIFCSSATLLFSFNFIHIRQAYYKARKRLLNAQELMRLYDADLWGKVVIPKSQQTLKVESLGEWFKNTAPMGTFFGRLLYILGANIIISLLAHFFLKKIGVPQSLCFLFYWLILNVIFLMLIVRLDYKFFRDFFK